MLKENNNIRNINRYLSLNIWQKMLGKLPRNTGKRRILFITVQHLSEYVLDLWNVLRNDNRLSVYSIGIYDSSGNIVSKEKYPGAIIRAGWAYWIKWDLVITADHPSSIVRSDFFSKEHWPTLRIPHGIIGKKHDGKAYTYSKLAYDSSGRIMYSCIFAASEHEKRIAVSYDREYERIVKVVGSLQDDQLLGMVHQRSSIRKRMGIRGDEKVIFIVSTWGPNSLFRKWGSSIIHEAKKIKDKYRFIVSIHPLEYKKNPMGRVKLDEYFNALKEEGFYIREPDEDWKQYLVACDLIITDHTALSLHGALIRRPFVYVPLPEGIIEQESPVSLLKNISPKLRDDAQDLQDKIIEALNNYPYDLLEEVSKAINYYPGESKKRITNEIYELLAIAAPQ